MSFREELAQIMADSATIVYTEDELNTFTTLIKNTCRMYAQKGHKSTCFDSFQFAVGRNGISIVPRNHPQIMQIFETLGLDAHFQPIMSTFNVSW